MKKTLLLFPLFFILFFYTIQAQENLTLQQAVQISLENNYSIKIAKNNSQIAENEVKRANAAFMPVVTAGGQAANTFFLQNEQRRYNTTPKGDSVTTSKYPNVTNTAINGNITMNWTIFNGLGMFNTHERIGEQSEAQRENTKVTMENTIASVVNTYFTIIQQKNKLRVYTDALKISEQRLRLAKDKYEVGTGPKQDYLSAQVDYNADKTLLILQEQQYKNAKIVLNQYLSRQASMDFIPTDSILVNSTLNLEELRNAVLKENPQLLFAQHTKNAAYLSIKELQSSRFPIVNLFSAYNTTYGLQRANIIPSGSTTNGINYGVSANMTIFNGNNLNRQIQNAKINEQSTEYQIENLKSQLLASLEQTYIAYENNLKLAELERENLKLARQNVEIALERYKNGVTTSLEFRQVQQNAIATESRLIDAIYNAKTSETELLRISSKILAD